MANSVVDANVLLDWLLDRHPQRTKRIEQLFDASHRLVLPDIVFAEVVFALQKYYELTRIEIARNLKRLLKEPRLHANRLLLSPVIDDYLAHPSLSFVDCYLLRVVEVSEAPPLWTFDKKLVNQSGGRAKLIK